MPFVDNALCQILDETTAGEFDMLLGRRTYDVFVAYWPRQDNLIAKAFNAATKYVVTRSLDPLSWETSQPIDGDVVEEVRRLQATDGPALHVGGSSQLLQTLITADLVDEFRLWIFPVVLGTATVRNRRSATRPHSGRHAKHAYGCARQHVLSGRSSAEGGSLAGNAVGMGEYLGPQVNRGSLRDDRRGPRLFPGGSARSCPVASR